jgi:hypothetical protein
VRENADGEELDGMGTQPPFSARSRAPQGEDDRLDNLAMQAAKSADMGLRYDPLTAEEEFNGRTWDVWRRDLQISVPLTSFLGQVLIDFQRGVEQENRPLRARQFMETIAGLGPAFIKAGQALSSRPDLLPPEYLKELQKLQDRLPPFPNEIAFKIIEEQLGRPMSEVFERVEPQVSGDLPLTSRMSTHVLESAPTASLSLQEHVSTRPHIGTNMRARSPSPQRQSGRCTRDTSSQARQWLSRCNDPSEKYKY